MGDGNEQGLGFTVTGDATVLRAADPAQAPAPRGPAVLRGHVVCRGPDGKIKWEADTVPVPLVFGAAEGRPGPLALTLDEATILTGERES